MNHRLHDQHLHSWFSPDSATDPADNCRAAVAQGLAGLTFTDHLEWYPDRGWDTTQFDYARLCDSVTELRDTFGPGLSVGIGVEVGYQPKAMPEILEYLSERSFDLVLFSVHELDGRELSDRRHWDSVDPDLATSAYLSAVLDAVRFCRDLTARGLRAFDVLSHLDLIKRYTQRFCGRYDIRRHADTVDEILRTCLEAQLVPEINTSTWRQNLPEPMPALWTVARYAELGGTSVTLGSDAHKAAHIGAGLARAAEQLPEAGITTVSVFGDRRAEIVDVVNIPSSCD